MIKGKYLILTMLISTLKVKIKIKDVLNSMTKFYVSYVKKVSYGIYYYYLDLHYFIFITMCQYII